MNSDIIAKLKKLSDSPLVEAQGLGDVVSSALYKLGIPACKACNKRRDMLNRLFPFKPKKDLFK